MEVLPGDSQVFAYQSSSTFSPSRCQVWPWVSPMSRAPSSCWLGCTCRCIVLRSAVLCQDVRTALLRLVIHMVVANSALVPVCLRMLVLAMQPPPTPPKEDAEAAVSLESWRPAADVEEVQGEVIASLEKVMHALPARHACASCLEAMMHDLAFSGQSASEAGEPGGPALHSHLACLRKPACVNFAAPWLSYLPLLRSATQQRILQPPHSQRAMRRSSSWCRPRPRAW